MRQGESLWQDIRVAFRVYGRSPGATVLSIASIALGIGLTSGIFSVGDAMVLRPFPLERPGEILELSSRGDDGQEIGYGWPDYEDMMRAGQGVAEIVAYQRRGLMLAVADETEMLLATAVTPNYFSMLGVKAAVGRANLEPIEGRPAVVLGYRLWQRRFGGNPGIIGQSILLHQKAFVVTGVTPAAFTGLVRGVANDVWVSTDAWFEALGWRYERRRRSWQFEMIARLKPAVSPEGAAAQLDAVIRGPDKHKPAPRGVAGTTLTASFVPGWKANLIGGGGLLLALGLVLFVACANVAQLRLAQAEARRGELAIRMALGAGPWRVARQLLLETALIGAAGAGLGVLLAQRLMKSASEFIAAGRVYIDYGIRLDFRVLLFTLAAALLSVLLAGLAPARLGVRLNVSDVIKAEQGATGARRGWQRRMLIVGQVAVSVALFGLAVLFLESFRNAAAMRPGIDPGKRLLVMTAGPGSRVQMARWAEQLCGRMSGLPGVRGATFARRLPLSGSGGGARVRVEIPGQAPLGVPYNNVGGNYFSLMGTRVMAGRGIDVNDREGSPPVAVFSQQLARQVFPGHNPLGEWVSIEGKMRQVVGVAEDGPSNSLHEKPQPHLYLPYAQMPSGDLTLMVETAGEPAMLAQAARRELKQFDPGATIYSTTTLRSHMDQALSWDRMMAALASGLGAFGFLLTAAGLFGVIQYSINRRTREIGLRVALGAAPREIQRMVLTESLRMAAWGIPIGLVLLGGAAWYVRSIVLGVTLLGPLKYVASAAAAVAVTLAAAWLPARRATRVDPMTALRAE